MAAFRALRCLRVLRLDEALVDFADVQLERTHRATAGQLLPAAFLLLVHIDDSQFLRLRGRGFLCAATLHRLRSGNRRAGNRLVDDHHRYRRAADDIGRVLIHAVARIIAPGVSVDIGVDLLDRNADQHNRLRVLDQLRLRDGEILVHTDHDVNRLAGITAGRYIIRVEEDITQHFLALEHRHDGRAVLNLAITGGVGEKLRRRHLAGEFLQRAVAVEKRCAQLLRRRHGRGNSGLHKK